MKKITEISGSDSPPQVFSFGGCLLGLSYLYSLGVRLRSLAFEWGILKQKKLTCQVISIGNVVAGGTGKTPVTIHLAGLLQGLGKKVVVVSRGYKGNFNGRAAVVGDGRQVFLNAVQAGDEPCMMAALKRFPVVIGKCRYQAGLKAIQAFCPDVILLDDGFQHRQLKRDLDFVLMDYSRPLGNGCLLPAGRLREPFKEAVKRADAVIFTRSTKDSGGILGMLDKKLNGIPRFRCSHQPFLADYQSKTNAVPAKGTALKDLKGKKAVLFSALADNASFYKTMSQSGINILEHLVFKDHYRYKRADILMINNTAKQKGAQIILTTQKDWVKVDSGTTAWDTDVGIIGIDIRFEQDDVFVSFVEERCPGL